MSTSPAAVINPVATIIQRFLITKGRCKLLTHLIVEDLLNAEQFDINTQNNETPLSPQQKLNLEEGLYIKLYLRISQGTDEIIM
ncbi:uncharacterized protein OCT59_010635 [Rhizophagus irregularis]|uniref:uncharacterized protein n=1 Tax=Rhizophagus irregularis TaxID=588596 RepID=UPI003327AFCD|nr:hypothetical protein OCT59_010635 [Rhizophagus irregularis]